MKTDMEEALNTSAVFCIVLIPWKSNFVHYFKRKFPSSYLCSVDSMTQVLMNSKVCIPLKEHMHQSASFPQFLNS